MIVYLKSGKMLIVTKDAANLLSNKLMDLERGFAWIRNNNASLQFVINLDEIATISFCEKEEPNN